MPFVTLKPAKLLGWLAFLSVSHQNVKRSRHLFRHPHAIRSGRSLYWSTSDLWPDMRLEMVHDSLLTGVCFTVIHICGQYMKNIHDTSEKEGLFLWISVQTAEFRCIKGKNMQGGIDASPAPLSHLVKFALNPFLLLRFYVVLTVNARSGIQWKAVVGDAEVLDGEGSSVQSLRFRLRCCVSGSASSAASSTLEGSQTTRPASVCARMKSSPWKLSVSEPKHTHKYTQAVPHWPAVWQNRLFCHSQNTNLTL